MTKRFLGVGRGCPDDCLQLTVVQVVIVVDIEAGEDLVGLAEVVEFERRVEAEVWSGVDSQARVGTGNANSKEEILVERIREERAVESHSLMNAVQREEQSSIVRLNAYPHHIAGLPRSCAMLVGVVRVASTIVRV
eukprot:CAMPEP_0167795270 /NCGR_PEP_ID=MMETSP0111_2-20121227/14340_1 /TAXON_ID=91324 /ORGANISM="Lotharella globosa, Strain CCCM811" /LENGTH=135 /DNA_ID=CAMNT_0007688915 /DNA_START=842 /DNA_END=1249 /DNA_ORIENTATION=-